ncbi:hypothetical protein WV31_07305 [Magnetospirillum sp. ME-1]|uniref:hypothetical protein n=1 Tax=Magnetospirillum sp. ME-1 TaxID=1639348 RepID=UPI000A1799DC|nr:hypothetical protein [Magnetospirillum sp. ME-1]ARJ65471.1 hypothetical protein WV31_07305 [Magnetospirillum sp. ME-1]
MKAGEWFYLAMGWKAKVEARGVGVMLTVERFGFGHNIAVDAGTAIMLSEMIVAEAVKAQRAGGGHERLP